ncbi:acyltransferase domain-containing protein [Streptomyces sp. JV178]|uniref:acyltransferase domain-containing protein n=1 Tax=Streptomyces sp. JV178 TaxID=858632 RepID=UPI00211DD4FA|nr:acyltransferase domain-containing protein [Streptomyces sp. JV178]
MMFAERGTPAAALLDRVAFTVPALFALHVAQFRLLESRGVKPDVLFGYSVGWMAAAHVAGVFSFEQACHAVGTLSRLLAALSPSGAMAAVEAGREEVAREPGVVVAAVNGPRAVVVSGDRDAVTALAARWAERGRRTKVLRIDVAAHSPHLDLVRDTFHRTLPAMDLRVPHTPLVSDATARPVEDEATEAGFWVRELSDPVRFTDAVDLLRVDGTDTFLELGPGEVLAGMLDAYPPRRDGTKGTPLVLALSRDRRLLLGG